MEGELQEHKFSRKRRNLQHTMHLELTFHHDLFILVIKIYCRHAA